MSDATSSPVAVQLRGVTKTYHGQSGEFTALRDVDLDVAAGSVQGIVGFSGAGKSTLVRTVNLLERPTSGTVHIHGEDITTLDRKELLHRRSRIGMIFQHFNLLNNLTVAGNVELALRISGVPRAQRRDRVAETLEIVGLVDKARQYPAALSGGQKQRVSIARALANRPDILLCDEPTSAVDPKTTSEVLSHLARINRDLNVTIILVTHEMNVVRAIADNVVVMESGRIVEQFDPRDDSYVPRTEIGTYLIKDEVEINV